MTERRLRTRVGIVGAGPAGLLLAQLLARQGIESVVVENRSREYVEARIRAGVLEHQTVQLLTDAGVGERLHREGLRHDGVYLQWPGERHHIDFPALCGRSVWVYGQTEVVKDLIRARLDAGLPLLFDVRDTALVDVLSDRPQVRFTTADGEQVVLECDLVAGCDGFHGVSRPAVPERLRTTWERAYPFAWLGILAQVAPSTDELIYAWHPDGFAMHSMRSPSVSRLYLQVDPAERIEDWSDDRIWDQLQHRMALAGWTLATGPVLDKGITPMRSFVSAPMRHGNLFLAGDAAHIVPPTGAKGLNLAAADVKVLAEAIVAKAEQGRTDLLDAYSDKALRRVWRATHFSWWMTSMMHLDPHGDAFDAQLQLSQLRYVTGSTVAATGLAENYTGMPFEPVP
jgi:p-hydroxybenzoate 3-monooxygenase